MPSIYTSPDKIRDLNFKGYGSLPKVTPYPGYLELVKDDRNIRDRFAAAAVTEMMRHNIHPAEIARAVMFISRFKYTESINTPFELIEGVIEYQVSDQDCPGYEEESSVAVLKPDDGRDLLINYRTSFKLIKKNGAWTVARPPKFDKLDSAMSGTYSFPGSVLMKSRGWNVLVRTVLSVVVAEREAYMHGKQVPIYEFIEMLKGEPLIVDDVQEEGREEDPLNREKTVFYHLDFARHGVRGCHLEFFLRYEAGETKSNGFRVRLYRMNFSVCDEGRVLIDDEVRELVHEMVAPVVMHIARTSDHDTYYNLAIPN